GAERASRIAAFPDAAIGWVPDAFRVSLGVARREHPAALLSTSAPFSAHLVALAVHRCTGIPWIADFRDEWAVNPGLRDEPAIVRSMARRFERVITSAAHRVTVAADYFDIANPAGTPLSIISNGVDEADLAPLDGPSRPQDALVLTYVGT